jgi:ATP-dependent exoDNAse (exonuclease V) alpha subunit
MTVLTGEQQEAYRLIASGHNVAVLGQAGTGKTCLVRETVRRLRAMGKRVSVTASTGMAARQYDDGTTLHHWSGIQDGRYHNVELLRRLESAENQTVSSRIKDTDVLIVDEISMISRKIFEQVKLVKILLHLKT